MASDEEKKRRTLRFTHIDTSLSELTAIKVQMKLDEREKRAEAVSSKPLETSYSRLISHTFDWGVLIDPIDDN